MRALFLIFLAQLAFITTQASAFPLPKGPRLLNLAPTASSSAYDFEGIVDMGNCSGSLIRFENSLGSDKALILSNGHCLGNGFVPPGQFYVNRPSSRRFTVLNTDSSPAGDVRATTLLYATMTQTDISLYQLSESYDQILARLRVRPLTLASTPPPVGQAIEVISGYWQRGYACAIEAIVPNLHEENWVFTQSIRYTRPGCEIIGGTSGSPVIARGTRTVIAVNNTMNEDGERCTRNNPCEVDDKGNVSFQRGFGYGQETFWIYSCLNASRELDLNQAGCLLPHTNTLSEMFTPMYKDQPCFLPWGGTTPSGSTVFAYNEQFSINCRFESRRCQDGYLSGSYRYRSCRRP